MTFKLRQQRFLIFLMLITVVISFGPAARAENNQNPLSMQYPALYYGTVKTETGQPVAAGTVKAYVDGELCGQLPFQEGKFGLPAEDPYVARLIVYSASRDMTSKEVNFKVDLAGREYPAKTDPAKIVWESQTKQEVSLTVAIASSDGHGLAAKKSFPVFSDLAGHWAEGTVSQMVYQGLISGYEDETFRPDNPVSRAECSAILSRALDLPAAGLEGIYAFRDFGTIPNWAQKTVAQTVAAGLFSGYPEPDEGKTFRPDRPVSRVELVAILSRFILSRGFEQISNQAQFADQNQIPEWAREAVNLAVANGLVKGYPDGTFQPQKEVNRAEAAAMIARLLNSL